MRHTFILALILSVGLLSACTSNDDNGSGGSGSGLSAGAAEADTETDASPLLYAVESRSGEGLLAVFDGAVPKDIASLSNGGAVSDETFRAITDRASVDGYEIAQSEGDGATDTVGGCFIISGENVTIPHVGQNHVLGYPGGILNKGTLDESLIYRAQTDRSAGGRASGWWTSNDATRALKTVFSAKCREIVKWSTSIIGPDGFTIVGRKDKSFSYPTDVLGRYCDSSQAGQYACQNATRTEIYVMAHQLFDAAVFRLATGYPRL